MDSFLNSLKKNIPAFSSLPACREGKMSRVRGKKLELMFFTLKR